MAILFRCTSARPLAVSTHLQVMADGAAGGGATILLGLVARLVEDGNTVHVLTEASSYVSVQAVLLGAIVHTDRFFRSKWDPGLTHRLVRLADQVRPDIIHLHGGRAMFAGRRVGRSSQRRSPVVYTVHGYHFAHRSLASRVIGGFGERLGAKGADAIVFVCEFDRALGSDHGWIPASAHCTVIRNGVDTVAIAPGLSSRTPRPQVMRRIAFIGRLVEQKDPLLALSVLALMADDIELVMIGGGALEAAVLGRVKALGLAHRVRVLGAVDRTPALTHLAEADVMLMTSRWEGLPVAAIESMALGVPVVAPAISGIPEVVAHGVSGLLVNDRSPGSFVEALNVVLAHDMSDMRVSARERATTDFDWSTCAGAHIDLYARMASFL